MSEEKTRVSGEVVRPDASSHTLPTVNPDKAQPPKAPVHPVVYIAIWIALSSAVILFNKWILDTLHFRYPVILTTYHLSFATLMTQILARTTTLLDGRKNVKMTGQVYLRAIVPIGVFFSLSLICGNLAYLYLSVAFIQMLKATTPVFVLLSGWCLGVQKINTKVFLNVSGIVVGVIIATVGEIKFDLVGVLYQLGGVVFESMRLAMIQRVLSGAEYKMDPLVSLYYYAPICAVMNFIVAAVWEFPRVSMADFQAVGGFMFFLNGMCAFLLNVSVVFLVGKTSAVVLTLSGVFKDIMLVVASMLIWGTLVTPLQFFGYSIALGGMVYYKLGYDQLKGYVAEGGRQWADFGVRKPVLRKLSVIVFTIFLFLACFGGLAPSYVTEYDPSQLASEVSNRFGMKGELGSA